MPTTSSWPRKRGTTLVESLATSFVVLLLIGVVAMLVSRYGELLRQSHARDESLDVSRALASLRSELFSAVNVSDPSPGTTSLQVVFTRVDPNASSRFPAQLTPTPSPLPASWEPLDPGWLAGISYRVQDRVLSRITPTDREELARNLEGFSAQRSADGRQLTLTGSYQDRYRLNTYRLEVPLP